MKVEITYEQARELVDYLPETGEFFRKRNAHKGKELSKGWPGKDGYLRYTLRGKHYRAHRLAWLLSVGKWPDGEIDHINGDKQDNRITNLRVCTHQQNNHNQGLRKTNSSGHKNVHWFKAVQKWHVQVCKNRKIHNGGLYANLDDAVLAARQLRIKLHGEFANHG
ncbi:hypothetical protein HMPREF1487_04378 [Pseudomonas sp. HPB0071]|uniref:HNH endonuclease n=1 Tax=unclassified Pseudomonas TaxID=196821 RepID=UPI0002CCA739|nr:MULTISPECIES: HNH endonuclease [unclassified Pseudomonas]ENA37460.1 hypothetical protein HMPREF1487_04378 [Pseudomonas sp. HPB0071]